MGFSRDQLLDLRMLGAIAAGAFTLAMLLSPERQQQIGRPRVARGEPGFQIMSFAVSPTGKQIATTNSAGQVALWGMETGWRIDEILECEGYARTVAFSPDGRWLAAAGIAPGICLWDMTFPTSARRARAIAVPIEHATNLLFSPDGESLAVTTDRDGTIMLWHLAAGRERMILQHSSPVTSIAFSPDGRSLAAGLREDRSILLWDLQTGAPRTLLENGPGPVTALAFSPDGALLASVSVSEHHARLWDLGSRRGCRLVAEHERALSSVAFSPDGALLATAGDDGFLGLWNTATGQRRLALDGQATWLHTVLFSPDGQTLFLATGDDDDVRYWHIAELL